MNTKHQGYLSSVSISDKLRPHVCLSPIMAQSILGIAKLFTLRSQGVATRELGKRKETGPTHQRHISLPQSFLTSCSPLSCQFTNGLVQCWGESLVSYEGLPLSSAALQTEPSIYKSEGDT